jgi:T-complex protein 1 subunit theta
LNKLVVNQLDKLFLTSDAGTVLRELDIQHPAAKLIYMASQQQDREVGDGTNLVVVLAGELLANAEQLLRLGLAPAVVAEGFEAAFRRAMELVEGEAIPALSVDNVHAQWDRLRSVIRTAIASKQAGMEEGLADLLLEAVQKAMPKASPKAFDIDNVRCVKILGAGFASSHVVPGMVLGREPETFVQSAAQAKVAVYACPLSVGRTETKSTVLLHGAQEMLDFSKGEERIVEEQIGAIAAAGVKVLVTGDQIGELALHFINRHGLVALRIQSKFDLRRFCRATNAVPLSRLGAPTEEEAGYCHSLETLEIGGDRVVLVTQAAGSGLGQLSTIILRGNTRNQLDDMERAVEDAVSAVKTAVAKDGRVLPGAGAAEIELARKLTALGERTPGLAQYGIKEYARAFEAVPRLLATNAGLNVTETIARLYWAHDQGKVHAGVDLDGGSLLDAQEERIVDLLAVKKSAIMLATEAALTVLRVDQIIMAKPAGGPKPKGPGPQDEDD